MTTPTPMCPACGLPDLPHHVCKPYDFQFERLVTIPPVLTHTDGPFYKPQQASLDDDMPPTPPHDGGTGTALSDVCEALGWQGGTIHQAVNTIKALREIQRDYYQLKAQVEAHDLTNPERPSPGAAPVEQGVAIWMCVDIELPPAGWSGSIKYANETRTAGYNGKHFTSYLNPDTDDPFEPVTHWLKHEAALRARSPEQGDVVPITNALLVLGWRIEKCGASVELTNAVTLCSDLRTAIERGDKWAIDNVLKAVAEEFK